MDTKNDRRLRQAIPPRPWVAGILSIASLLLLGCSGGYESSGYEEVQIAVSRDFERGIEKAAPKGRYHFLARADSRPATLSDMAEGPLVICGDKEEDADLKIMILETGDVDAMPFASVSSFFLNERILAPRGCGGMLRVDTVTVTREKDGKEVEFRRTVHPCAGETPVEEMVSECLRVLGTGLLLVEKGMDLGDPTGLVKVVFTS